MLKPFQDSRKMCHQYKSDLKALFSLVMKCSFLSFAAVKYIRDTKVFPGLTTLVAYCNVPTSDNTSFFIAFFFGSQAFNISRVLESLSAGNLISIQLVSSMTPRKHKDVAGPSGLSVAKRMPRSLHNDVKISTLRWHTWESGGPIVK